MLRQLKYINMIYIIDNFLSVELLRDINEYLVDFEKVNTPGKSFWVKMPSKEFMKHVCDKLEDIEGCSVEPVLGFFREAKEGQDNDWRIHCDSIIHCQQPDRAAIIYMSEENAEGLNGTAFWSHKHYGYKLNNPEDTEEYNRLLTEDANDLSKWELNTVIGHRQNRLLSYPCNNFHSKYPKEFKESRKVFVIFYKTQK